jgi:lysine biosynthesis protein LysW
MYQTWQRRLIKGEMRMTVRSNGPGSARPRLGDWLTDGVFAGDLEGTVCPGCGGLIQLTDPTPGDRIDCPDCGEKLEVISLHPIDLDYAFEDEDWQDFEDEEEDEDGEFGLDD